MTDRQRNLISHALIVAACVTIYAQTYAFDFINIDDRAYIWENPAVISGLNGRSFVWAFSVFHSGNWHPLTWLSHMLDVELFGGWAGGHHLMNAVLHTINSLLVSIVLRRMTGSVWKSCFAGLLFAIHPTHVESVAWVAERKDVLSTLFWFLTMLAYLWYVEARKAGSPATRRLIVVVILFALGLMAKPMLVTLPFALLLCDYWPLDRLKRLADLRPLVIEKLPLFALTVASSLITFLAQSSAGATVSIAELSLTDRLANVVLSYAKYIVMFVYPVDLAFWYPRHPGFEPMQLVGAAVLLLLVTAFVWFKQKGNDYLVFGWSWYLGTLVPVIGLVQVGAQSHADRYTYIPYFGLAVMLVWGVASLVQKFRIPVRLVAAVAAVVLITFTVLAYRQTSLWRDVEVLYTDSLSKTRDNHFLMSNLCLYYLRRTDVATADRQCTRLLEPLPPIVDKYEILGYLRLETGRFDEAVSQFREGLRLAPDSAVLHVRLAHALAKRGEPVEAERSFQNGIAMNRGTVNPDMLARACNAIADAFLKVGRRDKASEYFKKALEFKPTDVEARSGLNKLGG